MARTHPSQGDPVLHAFARLVADVVGADAAGIWIGGNTGRLPVLWGAHHFPDAATTLQAHFGPRLWIEPIDLQNAHACPPIDGRVVDQFVSVPFKSEAQHDTGLLVCLRYAPAPPDEPISLDQLQTLARHVPASAVQDNPTPPLAIRLRGTLQALEMGYWTYRVPSDELFLAGDAAGILGTTDTAPCSLDVLLGALAADSAPSLRHAFDACIRDGQVIDVEVEFTADPDASRWVRILGEAASSTGGAPQEIHGVVQDVSARRQAQEETMRLAMRLTTTLASISEAFATLDREGRFTYVNKQSEHLLGQAAGDLLDQPIHEKLVGKNPALLRQEIARALAEDRRVEFEDYYPSLSMWLELRAYPYAEGLAVYLRDVTQRREAQERLTLLRTSIARINDSVVIIQATGAAFAGARIIFVNESFERLTGLSRNEVGGRSPRILKQSIGAETFRSLMRDAGNSRSTPLLRRELLLPRPDGAACWMDLDLVAVRDLDGSLVHWVAVGRDVTERKLAEQKIHHLAFFDPLTLLPNRQLLIERLNSALEQVTRSHEGGALMFIDLDDFKTLNDTRGHPQGDLLLQQVAQRLTGCLRKADTVARIGGDEFVVLLQDLGPDPDIAERKAHAVATKLLTHLAEPFNLGQHLHHCTTSIGVTCFDAKHGGVDELLKQADVAMYQAKGMGGNTLAFFDPAMQAKLSANAELGADLRAALQTFEQFVVHYQPICDGSRRTIGVEALLRWQHPLLGLCSPAEFIPLAEDTGLIVPLGQWVLQQACAQLAAWALRPETAHLSIAVNVSVGQFRYPEFVEQMVQALTDHGAQPRLLKLELTESLLADRQDITLSRMDTLKRLGVSFSLDDFGTGYSSLSYLKRLPLDQLKIDKGFVADVLTDPSDAAIARAVIELAHSLQLPVIAEGVETEEQYQFLARCGCDLFQGYLLAHPMPLDELEAFLSQQVLEPNQN